jgi:hypothetical protein
MGRRDSSRHMKKGISTATRLESIRCGDTLILQEGRYRVLSSQADAGLVTVELENDAPHQPPTLIGVPSMPVNVESSHDSRRAPGDPASGGSDG